jgi:hypothetical protein
MVAERHRGGRVITIEDRKPAQRTQHPERLGEGAFGTGHVSQRRVKDDDIEGFVLERQGSSVGLSEGEVRPVRGQLAGLAQQGGRHIDTYHRADIRPEGKCPRQHPRTAAHLKYARIGGEGDVGEEGLAHLPLLRVSSSCL